MNIAFYAPLKPPDHPSPSGDRRIARLIMKALEANGHRVEIASRFRSREGRGDEQRQRRLRRVGERLGARLARRWLAAPPASRPALWLTYHLYYKAPDWLGPAVSRALAIPYVVAEASHAPKRDRPPWQMAHRAVGDAIAGADAIVALNSDDVPCLLPLLDDGDARVHRIAPFIDASRFVANAPKERLRARLAQELGLHDARPWLLTVAMMRPGDKLASYRMLADALGRVGSGWQLVIVGDGPAYADVHAAFAAFGDAVRFAGLRTGTALVELLGACDLYLWPAVNEAFGMAFLEAEAAGLAVVAGRSRGVPDVVSDGVTGILTPLNAVAFARGVAHLLDDVAERERLAGAAREYVLRHHDIHAAGAALDAVLSQVRRAVPTGVPGGIES